MCEGNLLNILVILLIMFVLTDISNSKHTSAQWFKASLQIMLRVNFAFQFGLRIGKRSASPDPVHRWKTSTFQSITFPVNQQWFIDAPFGVFIIKTYELVCNCTFTGVSDALIPVSKWRINKVTDIFKSRWTIRCNLMVETCQRRRDSWLLNFKTTSLHNSWRLKNDQTNPNWMFSSTLILHFQKISFQRIGGIH